MPNRFTASISMTRVSGKNDVIDPGDTNIIQKPTVSFPQEILEHFIDHLQDDKEALQECSLVCRAWLPRSRYYLFERVTVSPPSSTPIHCQYPFYDLIASLNHPLCTFASAVRKISISESELEDSWGNGSSKTADSDWISLFTVHLDKLPSVTLLDITFLNRVTINCFKSIALEQPSFSSQITHLLLDICYFTSQQSKEIMKIIHSFLALSHLQVEYDDEDRDSDWNSRVSADTVVSLEALPPKYLKELAIYSCQTIEIPLFIQLLLLWLRESQTRLSTLTFSLLAIKSVDNIIFTSSNPLARYLKFLGPSLESLTLAFVDFTSICSSYQHGDLREQGLTSRFTRPFS